MSKFKEMKFQVNSPEHSKKIQEKLFEMGYRWWSGREVRYVNSPYLFTNMCGTITHRSDSDYPFEAKSKEEHEIVEVVTYELKPVSKKDVVIFDGKKYNKANFKELLKEVINKL